MQHISSHDCIQRQILLPDKNEYMFFKNFERKINLEFEICADFESFLVPNFSTSHENSSSIICEHIPCLGAYKILYDANTYKDDYLKEIRIFKGENICKEFLKKLISDTIFLL